MDEFGGWVDLTVLHIFLESMRLNLLKGRQSSSKQIILFRELFSIVKHMIIYISLRVTHSLLWTLKITIFIFTKHHFYSVVHSKLKTDVCLHESVFFRISKLLRCPPSRPPLQIKTFEQKNREKSLVITYNHKIG